MAVTFTRIIMKSDGATNNVIALGNPPAAKRLFYNLIQHFEMCVIAA